MFYARITRIFINVTRITKCVLFCCKLYDIIKIFIDENLQIEHGVYILQY